jgi:hypothetical protein
VAGRADNDGAHEEGFQVFKFQVSSLPGSASRSLLKLKPNLKLET